MDRRTSATARSAAAPPTGSGPASYARRYRVVSRCASLFRRTVLPTCSARCRSDLDRAAPSCLLALAARPASTSRPAHSLSPYMPRLCSSSSPGTSVAPAGDAPVASPATELPCAVYLFPGRSPCILLGSWSATPVSWAKRHLVIGTTASTMDGEAGAGVRSNADGFDSPRWAGEGIGTGAPSLSASASVDIGMRWVDPTKRRAETRVSSSLESR